MSVIIIIPGEFLSERKRQVRMGQFAARVDAPDRKDYKAKVALFASRAMAGRAPLEGPVEVQMEFMRPKPPSWPKNPCKTNPWPDRPWKKPDLDNLVKCVSDPLSGIIYHDDAQVVHRVARKAWGTKTGVCIAVVSCMSQRHDDEQDEKLDGLIERLP